jgi:hypothetical protein
VTASGKRSWALGGAGAGFFFFLPEVPPAELRLDSDDTDPNLSLLFVTIDFRGTGHGSGVTPLHMKCPMHSSSNICTVIKLQLHENYFFQIIWYMKILF